MWVPRNGAEERHTRRVTGIVTDHRATQYWDGRDAVMPYFDAMLDLTGPCAGIFAVYGPAVEDPAERAKVIQAVAALDLRFQEGGLSDADYRAERQELMARILDPDKGPNRITEGVQPE